MTWYGDSVTAFSADVRALTRAEIEQLGESRRMAVSRSPVAVARDDGAVDNGWNRSYAKPAYRRE